MTLTPSERQRAADEAYRISADLAAFAAEKMNASEVAAFREMRARHAQSNQLIRVAADRRESRFTGAPVSAFAGLSS